MRFQGEKGTLGRREAERCQGDAEQVECPEWERDKSHMEKHRLIKAC